MGWCPELGDMGQDPSCTLFSFCFEGAEGDLCPPPLGLWGTVPRREPCRQGRTTEVGGSAGPGSPSRGRGWAAQGQPSHAAMIPRRARPCGHHWPCWSGRVGRAAGNVSGGPQSPALGDRAWALPSSAVAEQKPLEVSELRFSHF